MPETKKKKKETQAEILVNQASKLPLFHTSEGEVYIRIPVANHYEVWHVRSKGFRRWLSGLFFQLVGKPPSSQAMSDALNVIEGLGQFQYPEEEVHVRMAMHEEKIYLDLCNGGWEVIEVTKHGWNVLRESPVNFRRPKGSLPLPYPDPNGDIDELKRFLPDGDGVWKLFLGWLIQAARPIGPYPVLVLHGEQGSAKSTLSRLLKGIVDPSTVPLRTMPRSERDLAISANNGWILVFDNVSKIKDWLSDAICRLSTGGGFATRELYSNNEEVLFNYQRPVILNGIDEMVTRHDLADRCLFLNFPPIPDKERLTEKELTRRFEKARPLIFGALLDVLSTALNNIADITLKEMPRMADFACWVQAAEPALSWSVGGFVSEYQKNRREVIHLALDADTVGAAIREMMKEWDYWEGTAQELLDLLEEDMSDKAKGRKEWPKAANALSRKLTRLASFLRRSGIDVAKHPPEKGIRRITINRLKERKTVDSVETVQDQEISGSAENGTVYDKDKCNDNEIKYRSEKMTEYQGDNDKNDKNDKKYLGSVSKKPTPEKCGDCENLDIDHMRIGCKQGDVSMKRMEKCPMDRL